MGTIYITPECKARIDALVKECSTEINGIAKVTTYGDAFFIDEIAVLKQEVSGTHAEMDTDDLANFLALRDDFDQWKCQWHSHVHMGVFWSPTDEGAIKTIGETGDWLISMVFNKKGEVKTRLDTFNVHTTIPEAISAYFPETHAQLTKHDIPLQVYYPPVEDMSEWAKATIAEKVSTRTVVVPGYLPPAPKKNTPIVAALWDGEDAEYDERTGLWRRAQPKAAQAIGAPSDQEVIEGLTEAEMNEIMDDGYYEQFERERRERLENADRPLSAMVRTPITTILKVMAGELGITVTELREDYDEEAIKDLYEEYLAAITESDELDLAQIQEVTADILKA